MNNEAEREAKKILNKWSRTTNIKKKEEKYLFLCSFGKCAHRDICIYSLYSFHFIVRTFHKEFFMSFFPSPIHHLFVSAPSFPMGRVCIYRCHGCWKYPIAAAAAAADFFLFLALTKNRHCIFSFEILLEVWFGFGLPGCSCRFSFFFLLFFFFVCSFLLLLAFLYICEEEPMASSFCQTIFRVISILMHARANEKQRWTGKMPREHNQQRIKKNNTPHTNVSLTKYEEDKKKKKPLERARAVPHHRNHQKKQKKNGRRKHKHMEKSVSASEK